jgi:lysozyme
MLVLGLGSSGPEVLALQKLLLAVLCDPGSEDGLFGLDTEAAVRRFQNIHDLTVDGAVGWPTGETADALHLFAGMPPVSESDALPKSSDPGSVPAATAQFTANFEGFSSTPYQDSGGVWTYLFGSTRDPDGNPVSAHTPPGTRALGLQLMQRDLTAAATTIAQDVHVPLTAEEREALEDFCYNVGLGAFKGSTLLRLLNAGDLTGAADQFLLWDHAGGQVLSGLLRRRQAERAEFVGKPA